MLAPTASPARPDLKEYHPLARLRRVIRLFVLLEGVLLALVLGCLWFWFATALDFGVHYFFGIDLLDSAASSTRSFMLAAFGIAEVGILVWYILTRLFRDFSMDSLALVLEKRFPDLLGDRLITAVQLTDLKRAEKQGYSIDMIKMTMKEAKERVEQVPVLSVFNWRRLALLAWLLVGVSVFFLLLTYPVCVLLSLIGHPAPPALWKVLLVNGLLIVALGLVFMIPWLYARRSTGGRRFLSGLMAACVVGVGVGYYLAFARVNSMELPEYSWRMYHASNICVDRNLRFMDTRWPHDEYFVDWLDFPVNEKRIQANKTLGARAYFNTWIIADNNVPKRWRPVMWGDLHNILAANQIPPLPLDRIHSEMVALMAGDERSPVGYDKNFHLPGADHLTVNMAMALVLDPNAPPGMFSDAERDAFSKLASALDAKAGDPSLGYRFVRRVEPPESVMLHYGSDGSKQKGFSKLSVQDNRKNVFGLEQPVQLGDMFSVKRKTVEPGTGESNDDVIILRGEASIAGQTAQTPKKLVALVRPPRVKLLTSQESRPAYYYYLPPTAPRADTIDERRQLLRNLRQKLQPIRTEYPSDTFPIPSFTIGSEVELTVQADKKLVEVALVPRAADFPGSAATDPLTPVSLPIQNDGRTFMIRFAPYGKPLRDWHKTAPGVIEVPIFPLVTRPVTFDVIMKDGDNMTSTRTFTLNPLDDKPPSVNLFVDVIREVPVNDRKVFMCTAKADIPFTKESSIADDNGLHKIEFTYEYMPIANAAVVGLRAELAAWLWASSPLIPNIGDFLYRREVLLRTLSSNQGSTVIKGTVPLEAFAIAQARYAQNDLLTLEQVKERINKPLPEDFKSPFLNPYAFNDPERPVTFDLQSRLPRLTEKDIGSGNHPSYDLILDVRATDSNVVGDSDRTGQNRDGALVFRIVPEPQLQALIVHEEAELVHKFEEMLGRLELNQRILQQLVQRLPTLSVSTATSEQTRVEGIADVVAKAHELCGEIHNSYARILREYEVNRFDAKLTKGLSSNIIEPLKAVQAKEFTAAENELSEFQKPLKEGRQDLAAQQAGPTLLRMQELLNALYAIKSKMGDTIAIQKALQKLLEVIKGEGELGKVDLAKKRQELEDILFTIRVLPPEKVELKSGETTKVKVGIRMPEQILTDDPLLRFEIPKDSGLKVTPSEVKLADTATEATFEVTAGKATGPFAIRIIPSQGKKVVELKVIVR